MKRYGLFLFLSAVLITCALPIRAWSDLTSWAQAGQYNGLTAYVQCNTTPTDSGMYYWYIRVVNVSTEPVDFSWNMVAPGVDPNAGAGSAVNAGWSEPPVLPPGQPFQSSALLQITCVTGGYSAVYVYLKINSGSSGGSTSTAINVAPSNDIGTPVQAPTPTPSPTPTPCPAGWHTTANGGCVPYSTNDSGGGVRGQAPTPVPYSPQQAAGANQHIATANTDIAIGSTVSAMAPLIGGLLSSPIESPHEVLSRDADAALQEATGTFQPPLQKRLEAAVAKSSPCSEGKSFSDDIGAQVENEAAAEAKGESGRDFYQQDLHADHLTILFVLRGLALSACTDPQPDYVNPWRGDAPEDADARLDDSVAGNFEEATAWARWHAYGEPLYMWARNVEFQTLAAVAADPRNDPASRIAAIVFIDDRCLLGYDESAGIGDNEAIKQARVCPANAISFFHSDQKPDIENASAYAKQWTTKHGNGILVPDPRSCVMRWINRSGQQGSLSITSLLVRVAHENWVALTKDDPGGVFISISDMQGVRPNWNGIGEVYAPIKLLLRDEDVGGIDPFMRALAELKEHCSSQ
jgi:hypothetical protein